MNNEWVGEEKINSDFLRVRTKSVGKFGWKIFFCCFFSPNSSFFYSREIIHGVYVACYPTFRNGNKWFVTVSRITIRWGTELKGLPFRSLSLHVYHLSKRPIAKAASDLSSMSLFIHGYMCTFLFQTLIC